MWTSSLLLSRWPEDILHKQNFHAAFQELENAGRLSRRLAQLSLGGTALSKYTLLFIVVRVVLAACMCVRLLDMECPFYIAVFPQKFGEWPGTSSLPVMAFLGM